MDSVAQRVVHRQAVRCQARRLQGAWLPARFPVLPLDAAARQVWARTKQAALRVLLQLAPRRSRASLDGLSSNPQVRQVARCPE
jgi:hypothetical protein